MTHEDQEWVIRIFAQEVPEVAAGVVEIKGVARMAGNRSKVALRSHDAHVDCIGACLGESAIRAWKIVERLGGERIELVLWDDSPQILIQNALQPARVKNVVLHPAQHRATVVVSEDQCMLALGRRGENKELASILSGWQIDIAT